MATVETATLPPVDGREGYVWCASCSQALSACSAKKHLGSKKHADNVSAAPDAKKTGAAPDAKKASAKKGPAKKAAPKKKTPKGGEALEQEADPAEAGIKKTPSGLGKLVPDPNKAGNSWCGLCQVSLTPGKAEAHLDTARHQTNAARAVNSAVRSGKVADD